MNVSQYRQKIAGISQNLILWIEDILDSLDIVELIQEQLSEGKRGDGSLLPLYSLNTIIDKKERNSILMGERIALIDTGEFWQSFFATIYQGTIEIDAKDWKRDRLVERYGEEIFMLSKSQMDYLASKVRPLLEAKINAYLQ